MRRSEYINRLQESDASLLVAPGRLIELASELMARARTRGFGRADLEARMRETQGAGALLEAASAHLGQVREFIQARNALMAVFCDRLDVVDFYRRRLKLPRAFPETEKRIKGDEWLFRDAVAEAMHERGWIKPPGCQHISRYIRQRARQILWDRKVDDEQEHIKAGKHNIVIRNCDMVPGPHAASSLGYDEDHGMEPPRVTTIDFRLDLADSMAAINADPQFRATMAALLFDEKCWADLSGDSHFSTKFRRDHAAKLQHLCTLMAAYLEPTPRPTLEERIAVDAHNRRVLQPPDPAEKIKDVENKRDKVSKNPRENSRNTPFNR